MRYPKEHKEQIRRKLLSASGSHAKKHGFAASGVDALAASAGVTAGALYKHFDTKDALFAEVVRAEVQGTAELFTHLEQAGLDGLRKVLAAYASLQHVRSPETGCPLPTLAAEVARASAEVRQAYEAGILNVQDKLKALTGSSDVAWALIAQSVGAVMLARAMDSERQQRALLQAVRAVGGGLVQEAGKASALPDSGPGKGSAGDTPV